MSYDIFHIAEMDLKDSFHAFGTALHDAWSTGNFSNLRSDYTRVAANSTDLPNFDLIDPKNPPKIDKPGDYKETLSVDGLDRNYTVHVPPNYDPSKPMPVVFVLHGHGGDGQAIQNESQFNKEADQKGFIAVYPDAVQWFGNKQQSAWSDNNGLVPPGTNVDDVKFISSVLDTTQKQLNVDSDRVYAAGYSNGGILAYDLAQSMPGKFAAVAAISSGQKSDLTPPGSPVSVLSIHGTEDPLIPMDGLPIDSRTLNQLGIPNFASQDDTAQFWAQNDGINGTPTTTRSGNVTKVDYTNGNAGSEVVEYTVDGGNHSWFGGSGQTGADASINATDTIWNFFNSHSKMESA